ncbi:DUF5053 domain-containing protein [Bacteroidia bacterium]|nr:DUF5053 domain-containing protein [Bacteroidia bacterium]
MNAKQEVENLRAEFLSLNTDDQLTQFDEKFKSNFSLKSEKQKKEFANAFADSASGSVQNAKNMCDYVDVRLKMGNILDIVSMSYISENYFRKSKSWFSQRLNGHAVNGNPVAFTKSELGILSNALNDIGARIQNTARSIV